MAKSITVKEGDELTIDVLTWHEPAWEFDHPSCVLRPVVLYSPNGDDVDVMVEHVCMALIGDGKVASDPIEGGLVDRVYPLARLKRRWAEARRGVEFPVLGYEAHRVRVRFIADPDDAGELLWEDVDDV